MADNGKNGHDEEEFHDAVSTKLGNHKNKDLFVALSNYVLEAKQHHINLKVIRDEVLNMVDSAPPSLPLRLVEEFTRHFEENGKNLNILKNTIVKQSESE